MQDTGYIPKAFLLDPSNYKPVVSEAYAAATDPPATYAYSNFLPFEEASSLPVVSRPLTC